MIINMLPKNLNPYLIPETALATALHAHVPHPFQPRVHIQHGVRRVNIGVHSPLRLRVCARQSFKF
jgi:hypothetical protein